MKQWKTMSTEEKIAECERIKAQHPPDHNQVPKIEKQIELLRKKALQETRLKK